MVLFMAFNKKFTNDYGYKNNRYHKSKYTKIEKDAYRLGQIQRGLKNPNSKITASFNNGIKGFQRKGKPLF